MLRRRLSKTAQKERMRRISSRLASQRGALDNDCKYIFRRAHLCDSQSVGSSPRPPSDRPSLRGLDDPLRRFHDMLPSCFTTSDPPLSHIILKRSLRRDYWCTFRGH
jgi:hypothetical protein